MHLSEVDLECSRWRWKQTNPLTPKHLGDERFSALPSNGAVLTYWAHNTPLVVPDLIKQIREDSDACSVKRSRGLHEKGLLWTLFIETALECYEALALFG